jgi:deoxyhypusine monooxygenase
MNQKAKKAVELILDETTSAQLKNRAIFYLYSKKDSSALEKCFTGKSVLIDHEVAYLLGQLGASSSIEVLFALADDDSVDPIIRHESIEALGNFEDTGLLSKLSTYLDHPVDIIRESAVLAINKIQNPVEGEETSLYGTKDPAFAYKGSIEECKTKMEQYVAMANSSIEVSTANKNLCDIYEVMFRLRDINSEEAVKILNLGLEHPSVLLRHEVAYIYGQMENPHSVPFLAKVLEDEAEKPVVRHEAAEALGAVGTEDAIAILKKNIACHCAGEH